MTCKIAIIENEIRDREKTLLIQYIRNSINTFVFGHHGIGKTTLVNEVVKEYNAKNGQVIYIDCALYQTLNAILREILLSLGVVVASKSNYELIKRLSEKSKKTNFTAILDHSENMKNYESLNTLVSLGLCVCLVSDSFENYRIMNSVLKSKIAGVMRIEELPREDILNVLKENTASKISDDIIQKILEKSGNNLALALNLLRTVESNVKNIKAIDFIDYSEPENEFNEDQAMIIRVLRQRGRLPSGQLYHLYSEKLEYPKSERCFRNYMETLCKRGLVKAIGEKKGRLYEIIEKPEVNIDA